MKIFIFGNLASGKTHLASCILRVVPNLEYLSIDDFRKKFGDGSMENEIIAKQKFLDTIQKGKLQIIEATGLGETGERIVKKCGKWSEYKFIVILKTPLEVCMSRLKTRNWNVPYPAPQECAFKLAEVTHKMIVNNHIHKLWKETKSYTIIVIENLNNCEIDKLYNKLKKECTQ